MLGRMLKAFSAVPRGRSRGKPRSVSFHLVSILLPMLLLCSLVIANTVYTVHISMEKVHREAEIRLAQYVAELDKRLSDAMLLVNAVTYNADLQNMLFVKTSSYYQLARYRFWYQLYSLASTYQGTGSMFVCLSEFSDMLTVHFQKTEYDGQEAMRKRVQSEGTAGNGAYFDEQWKSLTLEIHVAAYSDPRLPLEMIDRDAVLRILHPEEYEGVKPSTAPDTIAKEVTFLIFGSQYDGFQLGVWLDAVDLLNQLPTVSPMREQLALYDEYGRLIAQTEGDAQAPAYQTGAAPKNASFIKTASKVAKLTLAVMDQNDGFFRSLSVFQIIVISTALLVFVALPFAFIRLNKSLLSPLHRMYGAIRRIGEGDLTARIEPDADSEEFLALQQGFNEMMECIETLKINEYESRLKFQEAEYDRLQLQINPHFFLNNLNMIHSFAVTRSYAPILRLTKNLSTYFRAALRRDTRQVRLSEEITMVETWLDIQKMRYPNRMDVTVNVDEELADCRVPVMIFLTFVENAVKYAMDTDKVLCLRMTGMLRPGSQVVLEVEDNGCGFAAGTLEKLNAHKPLADDTGRHIGIENLFKRMAQLYGDDYSVVFSNCVSGGARVIIICPMIIWHDAESYDDKGRPMTSTRGM